MIRNAPVFWGREPGVAAGLLAPLAALWGMAGRLRWGLAGRPYHAPVPVICIGNLVAGGAGKTPVTLALAAWLTAQGAAVHVVARGYGGRAAGPCRVDPLRHNAGEVGDEALLLAGRVPSWIARDRAAGVAAAVAGGAEIILLDDGFQNPTIDKTLSLIVVDAAYGFGNGRVMPAGPLRENLDRGLERADALIVLSAAGEAHSRCLTTLGLGGDKPVLHAALIAIAGKRFADQRVVAFCGIARPEKFFHTLRSTGALIIEQHAFPDHHSFSTGELAALRRSANLARARLVTTAKDLARLPPAARAEIDMLEVEVRWPAPDAVARLLAPVIASVRANADPEPSPG